MIEKCDAFDSPVEGAGKAHLPIEGLAKMGRAAEALKHINRFLRKQPENDSLEIVRMSELAAKICLDRNDLFRMEQYLGRAAEAPVRRKCDLGWPEKSVRQFRAHHGILDPAKAVDENQRIEATFRRGERRFREAMDQKQSAQAKTASGEMHLAAKQVDTKSFTHWIYYRILLKAMAEMGDTAEVKRLFKEFNRNANGHLIDFETLWSVGLTAQAIAQAVAEVRNQLDQLSKMTDPNMHFPARKIYEALVFLAEHGKQEKARQLLTTVLNEMPSWPVYQTGWTTAAVYRMMAEIALKLNDSNALKLLALARQDAEAEKSRGWRKGAVRGVMNAEATITTVDDAIAQARKMRSPTQRRLQLTKLLARARLWKELAETCSEAETCKEAAELCWVVKFELPGGEVKPDR